MLHKAPTILKIMRSGTEEQMTALRHRVDAALASSGSAAATPAAVARREQQLEQYERLLALSARSGRAAEALQVLLQRALPLDSALDPPAKSRRLDINDAAETH